ncbi:MAG: L-seryl-tRNA(Sec) selenium transferase, partial [candidate division Zixibacteria bacterium]|nr:L-seryl-tRNA(Sec) selenium transferase [candidate division Zixibacteria bacterium]
VLILKVHRSNFMIEGFTEEAGFSELAALGKQKRIPVVIDLGSGVLLSPDISGLPNEPTVRDAVKSKADLVCFSGDKLLGGCQAGIILGRKSLVSRLNRNPIYRVVRPDKITIGITEELFIKYLKGDYRNIPIWNSVRVSKAELTERSRVFIDKVSLPEGMLTIRDSYAYAGGGSDPGGKIESVIIKFNGFNSQELAAAFRLTDPPVIGRIEGNAFCVDLRTVLPHQEDRLVQLVRKTVLELNKRN